VRRKRLLFIGPLPEPVTGHSLACEVLLKALQASYDVDVVDLNKNSFREGIDSLARVGEVLKNIVDVARYQKFADLIYFTPSESIFGNLKDLLIYAVCGNKLDRMVIHLHGGASMRELLHRGHPIFRALNAPALRRVGGAIVLGDRLLDIYEDLITPERLHVAANFAQAEYFLSDEAIRAKFTSTQPLRILFLSNLLQGKGYQELTSAVQTLSAETRAAVRVDFAGGFDTPAREAVFRKSIAHLPEVTYHGVVRGEAKRALLAQAHVFCLPTYYAHEGQPISILEAYASGAAVVTTDHSGIFDVFEDGRNGLAVRRRSPADLAAKLTHAVRLGPALVDMGLENAAYARREFREHHFTDRVIRAIDASITPWETSA
jgi:glycosyltransferase involved in cell wall biosynthesis